MKELLIDFAVTCCIHGHVLLSIGHTRSGSSNWFRSRLGKGKSPINSRPVGVLGKVKMESMLNSKF